MDHLPIFCVIVGLFSGAGFYVDGKLTFVAIGDWGKPGRPQKSVANAAGDWASKNKASFVITTGDNFYENGVSSTNDPQWEDSWNKVYTKPGMRKTWYASLGNHDHYTSDGKYEVEAHTKKFGRLQWYMFDNYYTYSWRDDESGQNVQFIVLDTQNRYSSTQIRWFGNQLENSKADWIIVYGHHGAYSSGGHGGSSTLSGSYRRLMEANKVAFFIQGHDHNMEHLYDPENRMLDYITTGAGAKLRDQRRSKLKYIQKLGYFTKYFKKYGFAGITITGDKAQVDFIDGSGKTFYSFIKRNPREKTGKRALPKMTTPVAPNITPSRIITTIKPAILKPVDGNIGPGGKRLRPLWRPCNKHRHQKNNDDDDDDK